MSSRIVSQLGTIRRTISLRLELVGQRRDVALVMAEHGLSERYACKLLDMDRSSYRYEPKPDADAPVREALVALARQKPRFGYRRLGVLLERRGHKLNHKRLYRILSRGAPGRAPAETEATATAGKADRGVSSIS